MSAIVSARESQRSSRDGTKTGFPIWPTANLQESVRHRTPPFFDSDNWADAAQKGEKESVFFLAIAIFSQEADGPGVRVNSKALLLRAQKIDPITPQPLNRWPSSCV
jgi:hypothetical protein